MYTYIYISIFIYLYLSIYIYSNIVRSWVASRKAFFLFYISMYIYKIRTSRYRATCSPRPNLLSSPNIVESRDPCSHTFSPVSIHKFRSTNCCSFDRSSTLIHLAGYSSRKLRSSVSTSTRSRTTWWNRGKDLDAAKRKTETISSLEFERV